MSNLGNEETSKPKSGTAKIRFGFANFANAGIADLGYKFVVDGKEFIGKTNETGGAQCLDGITPGSIVAVSVLCEISQKYKEIGKISASAGETDYTATSPKIKFESKTEKHKEDSGKAATPSPEAKSPAAPATDGQAKPIQKTDTVTKRNPAGNPVATVPEAALKPLVVAAAPGAASVLGVFFYKTWAHSKAAHRKLVPTSMPSLAPLGTPLSTDNLAKLKKLVKYAEDQLMLDYRGYKGQQKDDIGKKISSTQSILNKLIKAESENTKAEFSYVDANGKNRDGTKAPQEVTGMCLGYVKVALNRTNYITGVPGTMLAKDSGADWVNNQYTKIVDGSIPQVDISYKSQKLPLTQPDLIYTLPGDVIIYEQVSPVDAGAAGHIDIRTYHGYMSDFTRQHPLPALGVAGNKLFKVTGVYRKISETMAMVRVQAFLRIIREHVAGETSLADKERSYRVLRYNTGKIELNKDEKLSAHPYAEVGDDIPAGAYQINYDLWSGAISMTGWPKTFGQDMQDRVAMYLLQAIPRKPVPHPRPSALGWIMKGEIGKAIDLIRQDSDMAHWPGGENLPWSKDMDDAFMKGTKESAK